MMVGGFYKHSVPPGPTATVFEQHTFTLLFSVLLRIRVPCPTMRTLAGCPGIAQRLPKTFFQGEAALGLFERSATLNIESAKRPN